MQGGLAGFRVQGSGLGPGTLTRMRSRSARTMSRVEVVSAGMSRKCSDAKSGRGVSGTAALPSAVMLAASPIISRITLT